VDPKAAASSISRVSRRQKTWPVHGRSVGIGGRLAGHAQESTRPGLDSSQSRHCCLLLEAAAGCAHATGRDARPWRKIVDFRWWRWVWVEVWKVQPCKMDLRVLESDRSSHVKSFEAELSLQTSVWRSRIIRLQYTKLACQFDNQPLLHWY
jgi:hypothetical protein